MEEIVEGNYEIYILSEKDLNSYYHIRTNSVRKKVSKITFSVAIVTKSCFLDVAVIVDLLLMVVLGKK